jgi:hypothetical protein
MSDNDNTEVLAAIAALRNEVRAALDEVRAVSAEFQAARATIDKVAVEVMPTIEAALQSPMLKMLGLGR